MAKFQGVVKQCVVCEAAFKVPQCRAGKAICCSRECKDAWWRTQRDKTLTFRCIGCGKKFTDYASRAERRVYCSMSCKAKYQDTPNRSGANNPAWKSGEAMHADGYVYVHAKGHPFAKNGAYVFEHRLVMERWLVENDHDSCFLVERDGAKYLDPKIIVHHRNGVKHDNRFENLECMTQSAHRKHHHNDPDSIRKQIAALQRKLKLLQE